MELLSTIKERNELLFWFGLLNVLAALFFLLLSYMKPLEFGGTNAYYKPIKFALSTVILSWSMAWYSAYLPRSLDLQLADWTIIISLAFEVIYIGLQAIRGQASHFNQSTATYAFLYAIMALAASTATLAVGYYGIRFWTAGNVDLPNYYLWAIRLGIVLFVIFSFGGFTMGATLKHSVGGPDGSPGLTFLNWSRTLGDLRVAHFIGMHALQILPFLAWYLLKDLKLTMLMAGLYALLALYVLAQALQAKPFLKWLNF